jgi:hypothetical protein
MIGGQIPTIGFIGLALAFREEDRRRPFLSGLALALCLYKPTLLVLIVPMLLVSKRYKTLTGLLAGGVSLAMFATALEGVGIWPGYIRLLLSFGSAAAQTHGYRVLRYYMDLFAFSSLLPGGRSWLGIGIVAACGCCALVALFSAWRKNAGAQGPAGILLWATTVTWTLVLNLYSPVYDSIIEVISVIATAAVLKALPEPRLRRQFTGIWVVGLIASWVTIQIAQGTGFQLFTVLFALFGALQLTALRKLQQSQLQKMDASEPVMASSATGVRSFPEAALACSGATYVR